MWLNEKVAVAFWSAVGVRGVPHCFGGVMLMGRFSARRAAQRSLETDLQHLDLGLWDDSRDFVQWGLRS